MLYRGISQVSVFGLRGTLYIRRAENAEEVAVQIEGPYEAKVAKDSWLRIYPEGQEPPIPVQIQSEGDVTAGRTNVGSADVIAQAQFLTDSGPRVRAPASAGAKATVRITAPPGTTFELISCDGRRKGPRSAWHFMRGNSRFDIR